MFPMQDQLLFARQAGIIFDALAGNHITVMNFNQLLSWICLKRPLLIY